MLSFLHVFAHGYEQSFSVCTLVVVGIFRSEGAGKMTSQKNDLVHMKFKV
jgi:hypothetical protein